MELESPRDNRYYEYLEEYQCGINDHRDGVSKYTEELETKPERLISPSEMNHSSHSTTNEHRLRDKVRQQARQLSLLYEQMDNIKNGGTESSLGDHQKSSNIPQYMHKIAKLEKCVRQEREEKAILLAQVEALKATSSVLLQHRGGDEMVPATECSTSWLLINEEQRLYIGILEQALELKAEEFGITGHTELLAVLAELKNELDTNNQMLKEKENQIVALQTQLEKKEESTSCDDHKSFAEEALKKQVDQLENEKKSLISYISEIQGSLKERGTEIETLKDQVIQKNQLIHEKEATRAQLQSEKMSIEEKMQSMRIQLSNSAEQIFSLELENRSLKQKGAVLNEVCEQREWEFESIRELQNQLIQSVHDKNIVLQESEESQKKQQERVRELEEKIKDQNLSILEKSAKIIDLKNETENLTIKLSDKEHILLEYTKLKTYEKSYFEMDTLKAKLAETLAREEILLQFQRKVCDMETHLADSVSIKNVGPSSIHADSFHASLIEHDDHRRRQKDSVGDDEIDSFSLQSLAPTINSLASNTEFNEILPLLASFVRRLNQSIQVHLTQHQTSLETWKKEQSHWENHIDALETKTERLEKTNQHLEELCAAKSRELDEKVQQICVNDKRVGESYVQELHAVKRRSQQALEAEEKRFKKLQLEFDNTLLINQELQRFKVQNLEKLHEATQSINKLQKSISDCKDQLQSKTNEHAVASAKLQQLSLEILVLHQSVAELQSELSKAAILMSNQNDLNGQLRDTVSKLRLQSAEAAREIKAIRFEMESLLSVVGSAEKTMLEHLKLEDRAAIAMDGFSAQAVVQHLVYLAFPKERPIAYYAEESSGKETLQDGTTFSWPLTNKKQGYQAGFLEPRLRKQVRPLTHKQEWVLDKNQKEDEAQNSFMKASVGASERDCSRHAITEQNLVQTCRTMPSHSLQSTNDYSSWSETLRRISAVEQNRHVPILREIQQSFDAYR